MPSKTIRDEQADRLIYAINHVAGAIMPLSTLPGTDATGGTIASLTEAVMGITAGLVAGAHAIETLASTMETR